jgi:hypothetical protein
MLRPGEPSGGLPPLGPIQLSGGLVTPGRCTSRIAQHLADRVRCDAFDFQHLAPAGESTNYPDSTFRDLQSPGYKLDQRGVGRPIDRRGGQPDLRVPIMQARELRFTCSRLYKDLNANPGAHVRSVATAGPACALVSSD